MYGCQGRKGERDELGDWNWHIYTNDTMYKTDNNENPLTSTGTSTQCSDDLMGEKPKKGEIHI